MVTLQTFALQSGLSNGNSPLIFLTIGKLGTFVKTPVNVGDYQKLTYKSL